MRLLKKFGLFCLILFMFLSCKKNETVSLKVLQINTLHECSWVTNGFNGLVNTIDQIDPDVVFLCELRKEDFVNDLKKALKDKGKDYYGEYIFDLGQVILSKYKLSDQHTEYTQNNANCGLYEKLQGVKGTIQVAGKTIALYSLHLDSKYCGYYLPRGYNYNVNYICQKMDAPASNADSVLIFSRNSYRDESVTDLLNDAKQEWGKGHLVIFGGDFNEPSHLDWQADTKDIRDHNGLIINWDCSSMIQKAGYIDAYRKLYPNPVTHPGFTFECGNNNINPKDLTWTEGVDDRERIDFVYYYPNKSIKLKDAKIIGPVEDFYKGNCVDGKTKDPILTPDAVWPSDHKGNLVIFEIK